MATAHAAKHPYHLVNPSPWPAVGAISAFLLTVGLVRFMHYDDYILFAIGVAGVLFTMFGWWRDVVMEAQEGDHTPVVQLGLRIGMARRVRFDDLQSYIESNLHPHPTVAK